MNEYEGFTSYGELYEEIDLIEERFAWLTFHGIDPRNTVSQLEVLGRRLRKMSEIIRTTGDIFLLHAENMRKHGRHD